MKTTLVNGLDYQFGLLWVVLAENL